MRRVPLAMLLVLGVRPAQSLAEDAAPRVHEAPSHGFRIACPDASWTVSERNDPGTGKLTVVLRPAGGTGTVEASLAASPAPADASPAALRATARAGIAGKPAYTEVADIEEPVAGVPAAGLSVRYVPDGAQAYRIRQLYLVRADAGLMYVFTTHAPAAEYAAHADAFAAIRASIELVPIPAEARRAQRLASLARRCGSEVVWAPGWEAAAATARREGRLVLVAIRAYGGFALSDEIRATTFMDPDVIALAREHLVCLRLEPGMPAPFRAQESYGLSATTFGQALLLVDPAGHVVAETCWLHPVAVGAFLRRALGLADPAPEPPRTDLARAVALLREGRPDEAAPLLAAVLRDDAPDEARDDARAEAAWWSGVCAARAGDLEGARSTWERLCDERPESRWAWKAAATLTGTAFAMGHVPDPRTPDEAVLATLHEGTPAPRVTAAEAEAGAVAWLLAHQRADGSWISPSEVSGAGGAASQAFVDAITALAGRALLRQRDAPRCREAAARARAFLLASHGRARRAPAEPVRLMDYRVWSRALTIAFLADCVEAGCGDAAHLRAVLDDLVRALSGKQARGGGWSYFLSTEPGDPTVVPTRSTSFVTATVIRALVRAREAGVAVPEESFGRAVACLEAMRGTDGAFEYMRADDAPAAARPVGLGGAAGRGPLCESALRRAGRGDDARVRRALEDFRDRRALFAKEQGKTLMHAGPDGQGCHYLLYDYACAAAALAELPAADRGAHEPWIRELVLSARSEDGAFQDTLINGWACGTALALLALEDLRAAE